VVRIPAPRSLDVIFAAINECRVLPIEASITYSVKLSAEQRNSLI